MTPPPTSDASKGAAYDPLIDPELEAKCKTLELLTHAASCQKRPERCGNKHCRAGKGMLEHIMKCKVNNIKGDEKCELPFCYLAKFSLQNGPKIQKAKEELDGQKPPAQIPQKVVNKFSRKRGRPLPPPQEMGLPFRSVCGRLNHSLRGRPLSRRRRAKLKRKPMVVVKESRHEDWEDCDEMGRSSGNDYSMSMSSSRGWSSGEEDSSSDEEDDHMYNDGSLFKTVQRQRKRRGSLTNPFFPVAPSSRDKPPTQRSRHPSLKSDDGIDKPAGNHPLGQSENSKSHYDNEAEHKTWREDDSDTDGSESSGEEDDSHSSEEEMATKPDRQPAASSTADEDSSSNGSDADDDMSSDSSAASMDDGSDSSGDMVQDCKATRVTPPRPDSALAAKKSNNDAYDPYEDPELEAKAKTLKLLTHAANCKEKPGQCENKFCKIAKTMLMHIMKCKVNNVKGNEKCSQSACYMAKFSMRHGPAIKQASENLARKMQREILQQKQRDKQVNGISSSGDSELEGQSKQIQADKRGGSLGGMGRHGKPNHDTRKTLASDDSDCSGPEDDISHSSGDKGASHLEEGGSDSSKFEDDDSRSSSSSSGEPIGSDENQSTTDSLMENAHGDPKLEAKAKILKLITHAANCKKPLGQCKNKHCKTSKTMLRHVMKCQVNNVTGNEECNHPFCNIAKSAIQNEPGVRQAAEALARKKQQPIQLNHLDEEANDIGSPGGVKLESQSKQIQAIGDAISGEMSQHRQPNHDAGKATSSDDSESSGPDDDDSHGSVDGVGSLLEDGLPLARTVVEDKVDKQADSESSQSFSSDSSDDDGSHSSSSLDDKPIGSDKNQCTSESEGSKKYGNQIDSQPVERMVVEHKDDKQADSESSQSSSSDYSDDDEEGSEAVSDDSDEEHERIGRNTADDKKTVLAGKSILQPNDKFKNVSKFSGSAEAAGRFSLDILNKEETDQGLAKSIESRTVETTGNTPKASARGNSDLPPGPALHWTPPAETDLSSLFPTSESTDFAVTESDALNKEKPATDVGWMSLGVKPIAAVDSTEWKETAKDKGRVLAWVPPTGTDVSGVLSADNIPGFSVKNCQEAGIVHKEIGWKALDPQSANTSVQTKSTEKDQIERDGKSRKAPGGKNRISFLDSDSEDDSYSTSDDELDDARPAGSQHRSGPQEPAGSGKKGEVVGAILTNGQGLGKAGSMDKPSIGKNTTVKTGGTSTSTSSLVSAKPASKTIVGDSLSRQDCRASLFGYWKTQAAKGIPEDEILVDLTSLIEEVESEMEYLKGSLPRSVEANRPASSGIKFRMVSSPSVQPKASHQLAPLHKGAITHITTPENRGHASLKPNPNKLEAPRGPSPMKAGDEIVSEAGDEIVSARKVDDRVENESISTLNKTSNTNETLTKPVALPKAQTILDMDSHSDSDSDSTSSDSSEGSASSSNEDGSDNDDGKVKTKQNVILNRDKSTIANKEPVGAANAVAPVAKEAKTYVQEKKMSSPSVHPEATQPLVPVQKEPTTQVAPEKGGTATFKQNPNKFGQSVALSTPQKILGMDSDSDSDSHEGKGGLRFTLGDSSSDEDESDSDDEKVKTKQYHTRNRAATANDPVASADAEVHVKKEARTDAHEKKSSSPSVQPRTPGQLVPVQKEPLAKVTQGGNASSEPNPNKVEPPVASLKPQARHGMDSDYHSDSSEGFRFTLGDSSSDEDESDSDNESAKITTKPNDTMNSNKLVTANKGPVSVADPEAPVSTEVGTDDQEKKPTPLDGVLAQWRANQSSVALLPGASPSTNNKASETRDADDARGVTSSKVPLHKWRNKPEERPTEAASKTSTTRGNQNATSSFPWRARNAQSNWKAKESNIPTQMTKKGPAASNDPFESAPREGEQPAKTVFAMWKEKDKSRQPTKEVSGSNKLSGRKSGRAIVKWNEKTRVNTAPTQAKHHTKWNTGLGHNKPGSSRFASAATSKESGTDEKNNYSYTKPAQKGPSVVPKQNSVVFEENAAEAKADVSFLEGTSSGGDWWDLSSGDDWWGGGNNEELERIVMEALGI